MRAPSSSLVFPSLVFNRSASFLGRHSRDNKPIQLFTLSQPKSSWPSCPWEFAVAQHAREVIRMCADSAERAWSMKVNVTQSLVVRKAAAGMVFAAFKLLSDCAWEGQSGFYMPQEKKQQVLETLLETFWVMNESPNLCKDDAEKGGWKRQYEVQSSIALTVGDIWRNKESDQWLQFMGFSSSNNKLFFMGLEHDDAGGENVGEDGIEVYIDPVNLLSTHEKVPDGTPQFRDQKKVTLAKVDPDGRIRRA